MKKRAEDRLLASRDLESELQGASFNDARLSARLVAVGSDLSASPGRSLPDALGNASQLAGAYRLFSNERVTPDKLLEPHVSQTFGRILQRKEALAVHDTTEMEFGGEREGLGALSSGSRRGFFMHLTLAVTCDGTRQPLGTLAQRTWVRPDRPRGKAKGKRLNGQASSARPERESRRWAEQVQKVESDKPDGVSLIHVGDRETDAFEMLQAVHSLRFVLRANHDRRVFHDDVAMHLRQACQSAPVVVTFEVPVSARLARKQPGAAKTHPTREARIAQVSVSALTLRLRQPYERQGTSLQVNVVHVREIDAAHGDDPVDWVLYTSEAIDTPQALRRVIDLYRARWVIEEFFKALKTGCEVQSLQLETYDALRNGVAIHLPIAWQILLLRSLGRVQHDAPAERALTAIQLQVLRAFSKQPLAPRLTVAQAMIAVAIMGGYLHRPNREPGWITLGRGMQRLNGYEQGWIAALAANAPRPEDV